MKNIENIKKPFDESKFSLSLRNRVIPKDNIKLKTIPTRIVLSITI